MLTRLEDYHTQLEAMMAEGDAVMAARDPASVGLVKSRITETVLLITSYQLYVHREIFAPLLVSGSPERRVRANELKVECIALTEDLRFNVREFMGKEGPLDWSLTAARVAWFNGRVREHIGHVRQLMTPGLSPADIARFRAHRTDSIGAQAA
ncbi:MAG: hypothetical protein V4459_10785 [Pseudomonadota bacterium]